MNVVLYSRVSTQEQDYKRQTDELTQHCEAMNYNILEVFEEKISGAKKNKDRPELTSMLEFIKDNNVDRIMCWELSRLGRNMSQIFQAIELMNDAGVCLHVMKEDIKTLDDEGKPTLQGKVIVTVIALAAELERDSIRKRMDSGYRKFISDGGKVGRREGYSKSDDLVLDDNNDIVKLLKKEQTYKAITAQTGKSSSTIAKVKKIMNKS